MTRGRFWLSGVLVCALAIGGFVVQGAQAQENPEVYGAIAVVNAIVFDVGDCSEISGWFWLRPGCRQYADWLFPPVTTSQVSDDDPYVYINLKPLVSNGFNGGSGWDTYVKLEVCLVKNPGEAVGTDEPVGKKLLTRSSVHLKNFFEPRVEEYTLGVGHQTWAEAIRISKTDLDRYMNEYGPLLLVRVTRKGAGAGEPEHVAVNQGCLQLAYKVSPR